MDCFETPIDDYPLPNSVFLGMVKKFNQNAYKYHVYNVIDSDGDLLFKNWFEKPSAYNSVVSFKRINNNFFLSFIRFCEHFYFTFLGCK